VIGLVNARGVMACSEVCYAVIAIDFIFENAQKFCVVSIVKG
jgi:hypothetical protein